MENINDRCDIRAAQCFIEDRDNFLRDLQEVARKHNTHIICFNADMLAGRAHAQAAVLHAARSFREGVSISNTLEMEALLYAAGSRQCTIAASFGIREGENNTYVCCYPTRDGVWVTLAPFFQFVNNNWDSIDRQKREKLCTLFDIPPDELMTLRHDEQIRDIILERVALLNVIR